MKKYSLRLRYHLHSILLIMLKKKKLAGTLNMETCFSGISLASGLPEFQA
jgi:hypothetical protein